MKTLKYFQTWDIRLTETADIIPLQDDEVIVNIAVCGICGTDIGIINGSYPVAIPGVTLGHEASGIVVRTGKKVKAVEVGDRVVINPTYSCHACRMCLTGNANHCERKNGTEAGVSYDGTFAGQYRAKDKFLIRLDDHVSMEAAALTEPLSCVITGVDKLAITHKDIRAGVMGAGPMGMLYLWALHDRGIKAFLVEKQPARLEYARKNIPPASGLYTDFNDALQQEYGNDNSQIDLCIDTTGYLAEVIFAHLAPGGKLLNVALKSRQATFDILKFADKSLSVIGSIDSLNNSFERAYAMIRDGKIPAKAMVSHVFDFSDYQNAFRMVGCDIAAKAIIPIEMPTCKVQVRLADIH